MKPDLLEGMSDFRREVKAVLHTALSDVDAPLVIGDLRPGGVSGPSAQIPSRSSGGGGGVADATKSAASCRVCTTDGRAANDLIAVDRELTLLEQSNAALFAALAHTRTMPVSRLSPEVDARVRSMGKQEEALQAERLREAAEIRERERRQSLEKQELAKRTRDLKNTVLELERQKREISKKLEEKRQRRERREADSRRRREKRRVNEEAVAVRKRKDSNAKEASRLRARLSGRAEQQTARARAKEALWRWRAHAAASVASRERRDRLAAEQAMRRSLPSTAPPASRGAGDVGGASQGVDLVRINLGGESGRSYEGETGAVDGAAATLMAPSAEYQGVYFGGGGFDGSCGSDGYSEERDGRHLSLSTPIEQRPRGGGRDAPPAHSASPAAVSSRSTSEAVAASGEAAALEAMAQHQAEEARDCANQRGLKQQQHRRHRAGRVQRRASTMEVEGGMFTRPEHQQQLPLEMKILSTTAAGALAAQATPARQGPSAAARSSEYHLSSGSGVRAGATARAASVPTTSPNEAGDASWKNREVREQQLQLSSLSAERSEMGKRVADAGAIASASAAVECDTADGRFPKAHHPVLQQPQQRHQQRHLQAEERPQHDLYQHQRARRRQRQTLSARASSRDEYEGEEKDDQEERAIQAKARTKALAHSLILVLRDGVRVRDERRVRKAFGTWREAAEAMTRAASSAAVAAGAAAAAGLLWRADRHAMRRSFRLWVRGSEHAKRKELSRQAALRQAARRAARRSREVEATAFQRWRLATVTAAVERLRQQKQAGSVGRGAAIAEAVLRRRNTGRVLAGFRHWREVDAELLRAKIAAAETCRRRAAAAKTVTTLLQRFRRNRLRRGLRALGAAATAAAERRWKMERASLSVAISRRATRTLTLTRCWGAWRAFATARGLARRLQAAGAHARHMHAERRQLRAEQLAWVFKAAAAASDARRQSRAWHVWRQVQSRANSEHALVSRVLVAAAQRWRAGQLRTGWRRWRGRCEAIRSERALVRSRAAKLASVAAFLGGGSRSLRTPRMDVARAFGTWVRLTEARKFQVDHLKRQQGARIVLSLLRSSRRNILAGAVEGWRSATTRRAQHGRHVQSLVLRIAQRQRVFLLGRAWVRIVRAAEGREATRARQLGAAHTVHSLLALSIRASRRRAWFRWRAAVADTSAVVRLHTAQRLALRRCLRSRMLRDAGRVWGILRNNDQRSREFASGAALLGGLLIRSQRRALSRRLAIWRSSSLSEAIVASKKHGVQNQKRAAAMLLGSAVSRVERRRLEGGFRAMVLFAAGERQVETAMMARAKHTSLLVRGNVERLKRRMLRRAWKAWKEQLAQRQLRGAVGAATSLLTEQTASLARQVQKLRLEGASRLIFSVAEQSNRALLRRGWRGLLQASQRRAVLVRAVGVSFRARRRRLGIALNRWRAAANDIRAARLRARAGRSVLAACLEGARRRGMGPAWDSWCELVVREREEEDAFAGREEGLMAFASVIMRVERRRDRERKLRVFGVWRLRAADVAVAKAQQQIERRSEVARAVEAQNADLLAAQVDCRSAGTRLMLLWLYRRYIRTQLAAWRHWTAVKVDERDAEERKDRRERTTAQLVRELARVLEGRRQRIVQRSLNRWHRHVEEQGAHAVAEGQEARLREVGARRLLAVLQRNVLRRQARVWARLVGSAVAAVGRRQRERQVEEQRGRLLAMAESRSSRKTIYRAWVAWKGISAQERRRGEVEKTRAASGLLVLAVVARRKEDEKKRQAVFLWRESTHQARQRELALSRMSSCLLRSEARAQEARMVHYLAHWRLASAMGGRVRAEEDKASAEAALRGRAILLILRCKRAHRLSEGFRRLVQNRTLSAHGSQEEQARRDNVSRGLHGLRRTITRRSRRRVTSAFSRWQCFAAEVGQRGDRALLVLAQRRAGAQMLGSVVFRHEAFLLSRSWTIWRSGAASAAIHDGERASADLRVSGARHSAGARLLAVAIGSARRRVLWKAFREWCNEAKAVADAEVETMEKNFHLARTLTRVEKRVKLARVRRAWGVWKNTARSMGCLPRVAERSRRAHLADGMTRWRVASAERGKAEAERGRAAAEEAARARALRLLLERRAHRQLGQGFHRILRHGAWKIYLSKEEKARDDRLKRGVQLLVRVFTRRKERRKLCAVSRWKYFASESRRLEERNRLQARGKRVGAKTLASLVSHREQSNVARAWAIWRSGVVSAAAHDEERASADLRVFGARRSAGCRLMVGVLGSARRRALAKAWSSWRKEVRAAAEAEHDNMEKNYHFARTLTRVERRTQLAKMGRAWRAWGEVVRSEGEAEVKVLERNFHIAQTLARIVARVHERRLLRAWGHWAKLAARGAAWRPPPVVANGVSGSLLSTFRMGPLAEGHRFLDAASVARASRSEAAGRVASTTTSALSHRGAGTTPEHHQLQELVTRRSRTLMYQAGAGTLRNLLRRAETRCMFRSWQAWRETTTAHATREARTLLGATRIGELFSEVQENNNARLLHRCWEKWMEWSTVEGRRLEHEAEAASWAAAEEEDKRIKAAAAVDALTALTNRWEDRALRARLRAWIHAANVTEEAGWNGRGVDGSRRSTETAQYSSMSPSGVDAVDATTPYRNARGGKGADGTTPSGLTPNSSVSALRRKLRGETSPGLSVLSALSTETRRSPGGAIPPPHNMELSPPLPVLLRVDSMSPISLAGPEVMTNDEKREENSLSQARTWRAADQFEYSSSSCSSLRPPSAGAAGAESVSSVKGRKRLERGKTLTGNTLVDDLADSLDLTASEDSVGVLRSYSDGRAASLRASDGLVVEAKPAGNIGSPEGSIATNVSDSSPLVGENIPLFRHGNDCGGGNGSGGSLCSKRERVRDHRLAVERSSPAGNINVNTTGGMSPSVMPERKNPYSNRGRDRGSEGNCRTGRDHCPISPPLVGGHASVLSLGRDPPPQDEGEEGTGCVWEEGSSVEENPAYPSHIHRRELEEKGSAGAWLEASVDGAELGTAEEGLPSRSSFELGRYQEEEEDEVQLGLLDLPSFGGDTCRDAQDFVDILTGVLCRWAFKRWTRVTRDAAFHERAAETNMKVMRLKRHQKLRRVVVSAIRRHNFTGHVIEISGAMRKWKQFVRRCREEERLSLEIAAFSPMTPMRSRRDASIVASGGRSGGAASVRNYGAGVEGEQGEVTPSFSRSPFPATSVTKRSSTRRRLWGQSSPAASPIENVGD